jgi:hypothetical protein
MRNARLQMLCKHVLETGVTKHSAVELLEAADRIGYSDMKQFALRALCESFPTRLPLARIREVGADLLMLGRNHSLTRYARAQLDRHLLVDILEAIASASPGPSVEASCSAAS